MFIEEEYIKIDFFLIFGGNKVLYVPESSFPLYQLLIKSFELLSL